MKIPEFLKIKRTDSIYPFVIALIILFPLVVVLTILLIGYDLEFFKGILIEAHGLLFDIVLFGIIITIVLKRNRRIYRINYYKEEIDDYRGWESSMASHRLTGLLRRLSKLNAQYINADHCFLENAQLSNIKLQGSFKQINFQNGNLYGANLKGDFYEANFSLANLERVNLSKSNLINANLSNANLTEANLNGTWLVSANLEDANFEGASIVEADLKDANLKNTNFEGAVLWIKDLDIDEIGKAKTLYNAEIHPEILKKVKKKYPHLLEKPK
ncbi:pentapeptide repeat-containing protein [Bacteroidota bacterium]